MKNTICLIVIAAAGVLVLSGCGNQEVYQEDPSLREAAQEQGFFRTEGREVDLVEQLAGSRAQYYADLEQLKDYYEQTGSQRKYQWAVEEAQWLERAPKYKYLMAAETAGSELAARDQIAAADELFKEGMNQYRMAVIIPVIPDKSRVRQAISSFNKIIEQYPTSDKVDDAAYRAGELYERLNNFELAANYYQKAYLWDDTTPYPARYRAARVLDKELKRRGEALVLYRMSLEKEGQFDYYADKARERINELTAGDVESVDMMQEGQQPEQ